MSDADWLLFTLWWTGGAFMSFNMTLFSRSQSDQHYSFTWFLFRGKTKGKTIRFQDEIELQEIESNSLFKKQIQWMCEIWFDKIGQALFIWQIFKNRNKVKLDSVKPIHKRLTSAICFSSSCNQWSSLSFRRSSIIRFCQINWCISIN